MTNRKTFKDLVRERAARTGESYTTARRHVLSRAAITGSEAGLVPGYPGFGRGTHHESTLLSRLLAQSGHVAPHTGEPFTEATACGLGGGIGFLYAVFEYRGLPPILTVVAQHHPAPWAQSALDHLGIDHEIGHSSTARPATAALHSLLESGLAVHCVVDRGALPWHDSGTSMPADPYTVVVAGRDGDELLIDDGGAQVRRIPVDQFAAAWSAYRKGRHQRITVPAPDRPVDLARAFRASLDTTVAHLTGPVLGNGFDANFGFSGMRRLAAQLRDHGTKTGWLRRFAAPGAWPFACWRLHTCLEIQYTAPGATRPLYADFLDEAASVLDRPRLAAAAESIRRAGTRWSAVASLARQLAGPTGERAEQVVLTAAAAGRPAGLDDLEGTAPAAAERPALLGELATLVDAARTDEEEATAQITGV